LLGYTKQSHNVFVNEEKFARLSDKLHDNNGQTERTQKTDRKEELFVSKAICSQQRQKPAN